MTVKIVTDSVSDVPPGIAAELDIAVVPLNIIFGPEMFQDGVDITTAEFYRRLASPSEPVPKTSTPTPQSFTTVYDRIAEKCSEILGSWR